MVRISSIRRPALIEDGIRFMKHVFLINNHMMFLMSMKVIEHEDIAPVDVILLGVRRYLFPPEIRQKFPNNFQYDFFDLTEFGDMRTLCRTALFHPLKIGAVIKKTDAQLRGRLGGDKFQLYAPHSIGGNIEILISMRECEAVFFLEEGSLAYACTPENNICPLTAKQRLFFCLLRILSGGRLGSLVRTHFAVDHPKFRGIYCAFDDAFRGFPQRRVIGSPFEPAAELPDDLHAIIVFDAGIVPDEQLRQSIEVACRYAAEVRHHQRIYYKFHPGQRKEKRDAYRRRFEELSKEYGIYLSELSDDIRLENIAMALKDKLDVFIICSSVGLYAERCGCNVFTSAARFVSGNPLLQRHYDLYGHIFRRYKEI